MLSLYEFEKTNQLMVVAHRGSSGTTTENTLAAFAMAIESGISIIELDIQFTLDNQIVVFHDLYPPNSDKRISELNYDQIYDLEIGADTSDLYDSIHIPLLEDVISLIQGKCYLMIEIKVNSGSKFMENVNDLINMINQYNYLQNTIFGSFSYSVIKKLKEINPAIYTAAIKIPDDTRMPSELKKTYGCEAFICSIDELNSEIEDNAIINNIFLGIYNVDSEIQLEKALQYNVRAIATNFPELILEKVRNTHQIKE